jgi:polyhydroxyalkanoate synthase subunit PhaC
VTSTLRPGEGLPNPVQAVFERMGLPGTDFAGLAGPLGVTPRETVFAQGTLKLHHYHPMADSVYRTPVLIVASVVNQPYILDLVPGQSLVESLLQRGYDVYMIEWGRPRREHSGLTLEDLVLDRLPRCVERVLEHSGERSLSMVGYCLGGFLAALYAARFPGAPEGALRNLVCIATPVNSDGLESLKVWMGEDFDVEAMLRDHGNVPAEWVQNTLRALRPMGKVAGAMNLLNQIDRTEVVQSHLRMGKWETDNIPFPGGVFRQMVRDFLRRNLLVRGEFPLAGEPVDLGAIRVPFLHMLAQEDHITPYGSSRDLVGLVGSTDRQEIVLKGGHVGLVAGRGAQTRMWPALDQWLASRSS